MIMILHATTEHEDHHKLGSKLQGATVVCNMSSNWQRESKIVPLFSSSKKRGYGSENKSLLYYIIVGMLLCVQD